MKKTIDIATWVWNPKVDANILFQNMQYVMDRYQFVKENPTHILYSRYAQAKMLSSKHTNIFWGIENDFPHMNECDWAFSFPLEEDVNSDRYMRLPNYVRLGAGKDLIKSKSYNARKILSKKTKFCAFICSNGAVKFRNQFFKKLSKYKRVDAPGKVFNNMPMIGGFKTAQQLDHHLRNDFYGKFDLKVEFLKDYKFVIDFENELSPGYTSERLYHAFLADCIPIYWGNQYVYKDFNTKSFLSLHDYGSVDQLIDKVIHLDRNDDAYIRCLQRPWYHNNQISRYTDTKRILKRFAEVFNG